MLNYHLRVRRREDTGRGGVRNQWGGRGERSAKYPRFAPEIRARGEPRLSLSRTRITKRNIVEPYISDGALMKHSRSPHSEITRDRLDYSRARAPGCSLPARPSRPSPPPSERSRALQNGSPRSLMRIREHPRRLILEPTGRL